MLRIIKYIFKNKAILLVGTIAMLIVIGVDSTVPYLQKILVDKAILLGDFPLLLKLILLLGGITLIKCILGFIKEYLYDVMGTKVSNDLRRDLFCHIQAQEFAYFDGMNTGELMSRIGEDVENIWQTLGFGLRLFIENIIYFIISTVVIFCLNWKLALACLVTMIPIAFIAIKLEKTIGACYGKISDQTAEINTTAQENIAGVRLIKAFARERHEVKKFLKLNQTFYNMNVELAEIEAKHFPKMEFFTNLSQVVMIICGGLLIVKGDMTLGTLTAFSGYLWNIIWPLRMVGWLTDMLSRTNASAKKVFKILDRESQITSKEDAYAPEKIEGDIRYDHVTFAYNEEVVLKNVDLHIKAGSTIAIMGTTGSGKSTLLHLIGRYYDVIEGTVSVDGTDVKDYNLTTLRSNMSVVPQDTFLFSDTIENNIKFGAPDATFEQVREACQEACILDFIEGLEKGFETEIGERGIGLSGGQKQRIAIARALLRKAPMLILDDATSALDMDTEYTLLSNLKHSSTKCTTFIIAHRISAVKNADLILYVENGEIKEQGKHEALLKAGGEYYSVYCEQFRDFEALEKEVV
ncbi:MAG: ABC transporter ATP-binding protein [Cellulosilyticaceae bacterium]